MTKRTTLTEFKTKALSNPAVKAEYDALAPLFAMKREMIALRKQAGVTQAEMAELMGTRKSNISRLESLHSEISPRLSTIESYAAALGYTVTIQFTPLAL
ncbi:helix-turn-helix domain-containing protein [Oceanicoccus sagamiensis]|uniref:Transcriptional regulator n=1 Tax=Oceanicoccus sagamiensis TaxID=716816 RepID=A0A1X9NA83_9GAMM|nr:helix-turn-helix transcriptional regulator [Oceanicoccus sagamiensis]ARN72845.1 transcriptional regulator [Oceanicoccus sagamiensis]